MLVTCVSNPEQGTEYLDKYVCRRITWRGLEIGHDIILFPPNSLLNRPTAAVLQLLLKY
jgi:hypothetical protein